MTGFSEFRHRVVSYGSTASIHHVYRVLVVTWKSPREHCKTQQSNITGVRTFSLIQSVADLATGRSGQ